MHIVCSRVCLPQKGVGELCVSAVPPPPPAMRTDRMLCMKRMTLRAGTRMSGLSSESAIQFLWALLVHARR